MSNHPTQHPDPDRLLELAYGELAETEADALHQHVSDCAVCGAELEKIGGVRRTMAPLGDVQSPEAGLESLLAYAEQSAERARKETRSGGGRKWWGLVPVLLTALLVAGGVLLEARKQFGASVQALSGEVAATSPAADRDSLAFAAPLESFGSQEQASPARRAVAPEDRSTSEERASRPEERKQRLAARPAPSSPPPPQAIAQLPSQAPRAERLAESGAEPAPAAFAAETIGLGSTGGGRSASAFSGASAPEAEGLKRERQGATVADSVGAEAEMLADDEARADAGPGGGLPQLAAAAPAEKPRRARKVEQSQMAGGEPDWTVPTEHTDQLREREVLRREVAGGGGTLGVSEALGRLCRLEDALEEHTAADVTCRRLLELDPQSPHAGFARERMDRRSGR